jgi:hypothetical protein
MALGNDMGDAGKHTHSTPALQELFARPPLPGQDPEYANQIFEHLRQECQPRGFIEELWLADVAWLTARIDYLRASVAGLYDGQLRSLRSLHERAAAGHGRFSEAEHVALKATEDAGHALDGGVPAIGDPLFQRLLGLATLTELDTFGKLTTLEQMLGRERDRVLGQFERRRREKAREALQITSTGSVRSNGS